MKLKRSLALVLTLLMLLPCFLTAVSALDEEGDWLVHESQINENGYVCTRETMKSTYGTRSVRTCTFDQQGRLLKEVDKNVEGSDSRFGSTKTCTYNKAGNLVTEAYSFSSTDGFFEKYLAVYTYDKKDRLIKETLTMQHEDGTDVSVRTLTYDAKGNKTGAVVEQRQADGITMRDVYTYAYDKQNRVVKASCKSASSIDLLKNETVKYTYKNGRLVKEYAVEESGFLPYLSKLKKTTTHTYDKKGNERKTVYRETSDDGFWKTETTKRTFDKQKRLLTETIVRKDSYGSAQKSNEVFTFDKNGFLTKHTKVEKDNDGVSNKLTETFVNDKKGNPVKKTTAETNFGDTTKTTEIISYDKKGRESTHKTTVRSQDGSVTRYTNAYTYDKAGNAVKTLVTIKDAEGTGKEVHTGTYQKVKAAA